MKMKIIWKPEARADQEWVVDRANPDWAVSYPVETATGWGWLEFTSRFDGMSSIAWRALLWALRKQEELRLPLESIEINWAELDMRLQCPACEEWTLPRGHECALPDIPEVAAAEDDTAEPKKGGKAKAGEA